MTDLIKWEVSVSVAKAGGGPTHTVAAVVTGAGAWKALLPPTAADGGSYTITVAAVTRSFGAVRRTCHLSTVSYSGIV